MKQKLKLYLRWFISILFSFVCIYLFIFVGGWKLLESGDPIRMELAAAIVVGTILFVMNEVATAQDKKIKDLEQRVAELEKHLRGKHL